jgi:hypothetical protein
MIAATGIVAELPLYTTNPDDFVGLDHLVTVISVTRPEVPNAILASKQPVAANLRRCSRSTATAGGVLPAVG